MALSTFPPHLCLAETVHPYTGDAESSTLSVESGQCVLVQGDRTTDVSVGWVWSLVHGDNGMLPASYLRLLPSGTINARALYDFVAAESNELSFVTDELLLLLPAPSDPTGWCMAWHKLSRQRGLVPQSYMAAQPPDRRSSPSASPDKGSPPRSTALSPQRPAAVSIEAASGLPSGAHSPPRKREPGVAGVSWKEPIAKQTESPPHSRPRSAEQGRSSQPALRTPPTHCVPPTAPAARPLELPSELDARANGAEGSRDCGRGERDGGGRDDAGGTAEEEEETGEEHGALAPEVEAANYVASQWAEASSPSRLSTSRWARPPPAGFDAAAAMDEIFHLGKQIAEGDDPRLTQCMPPPSCMHPRHSQIRAWCVAQGMSRSRRMRRTRPRASAAFGTSTGACACGPRGRISCRCSGRRRRWCCRAACAAAPATAPSSARCRKRVCAAPLPSARPPPSRIRLARRRRRFSSLRGALRFGYRGIGGDAAPGGGLPRSGGRVSRARHARPAPSSSPPPSCALLAWQWRPPSRRRAPQQLRRAPRRREGR